MLAERIVVKFIRFSFRKLDIYICSRNTTISPLKLLVEQKVLGWQDSVNSSALVLEYRITNRDSSPYAQLFAGIFADFDIQEFSKNKASWDAGHQLGYVYNHLENRFAGVALLNDGMELSFHALDIASRNWATSFPLPDTPAVDFTIPFDT